jgi:hypothetical protein
MKDKINQLEELNDLIEYLTLQIDGTRWISPFNKAHRIEIKKMALTRLQQRWNKLLKSMEI